MLRKKTALLAGLLSLLVLIAVALISVADRQNASTVYLAASEKGFPRFSYEGNGVFSYSHSGHSFDFRIEHVDQKTQCHGSMVWVKGSKARIKWNSISDLPYTVVLLGFSKNSGADGASQTKLAINVAPGKSSFSETVFCRRWHELEDPH